MSSLNKTTIRILVATIIMGSIPISLGAMIVSVANNGIDSPTCGGESEPCRSITQAISNADIGDTIQVGPGYYGDINYNGILGDAGEEIVLRGCNCMILVDKQVKLESTEGAEYTILDAKGLVDTVMTIEAEGAVVGGSGKGFTLMNANSSGIKNLASQGVVVWGNRASGNYGVGFSIFGNNHKYIHNAALANGQGFIISGSGHEISYNTAIGNGDAGFRIGASNVQISYNTAIGNKVAGIFVGFIDTKIEHNNIYGNEPGFNNCGLRNFSDVTVVATDNYWGLPTGPGADPADDVCNFGTSSTITTPFALQQWRMPDDSCNNWFRRTIRPRHTLQRDIGNDFLQNIENSDAGSMNRHPMKRNVVR